MVPKEQGEEEEEEEKGIHSRATDNTFLLKNNNWGTLVQAWVRRQPEAAEAWLRA